MATRISVLDDADADVILLDECRGEYWRVARSTFCLLERMQRAPLLYGEISSVESAADDIAMLRDAGLALHRVSLARPALGLVAAYAALNLWFQLMLRFRGWRVVNEERYRSVRHVRFLPHVLMSRDDLLSAARWAMLVPGVRADCLPHALTLHRLLRNRGYEAILHVGAVTSDFAPHIWVVVGEDRVDSGADDQALPRFKPLE